MTVAALRQVPCAYRLQQPSPRARHTLVCTPQLNPGAKVRAQSHAHCVHQSSRQKNLKGSYSGGASTVQNGAHVFNVQLFASKHMRFNSLHNDVFIKV